ncbi:serine acetyltransferase [Liquorilactobacillus hordei]|uniref:serine acetyltransferase n=1 Tax=Liquorilactobacillus hordei TaxID=468911 RepID=UPI0039EA0C1D
MFREIMNNPGLLPKLVVFHFRIGQKIRNIILLKHVWILVDFVFLRLLLNCELRVNTEIGTGLKIFHPYNIIINDGVEIGENCILRHNTTIGNNGRNKLCPKLGDNVNIGCGAVIIGGIVIGNDSYIGANTLVNKSFKENSVIVGFAGKDKG